MDQRIILRSSDEHRFEVDVKAASLSRTITAAMEKLRADQDREIFLPKVEGHILNMFITWANHHKDDSEPVSARNDEISAWDSDFLKVDQGTLFELMLAGYHLQARGLLDVTCKTVANMIRGRTPDEIRATFNIENDFSPQEEAQVRMENKWVENMD